MKITSKGQVTVPQALRELYGLLPHTQVEWVPSKAGPRLVKQTSEPARGQLLVERLKVNRPKLRLRADEFLALTRGE
jgi:bifunctional DNA-binding transcriptional regulator/antitoxin component of YhaV-PrlF toxin-antitoxin module